MEEMIKLFAAYLDEKAEHYRMTANLYKTNPEEYGSSEANISVWETRCETIHNIRKDFLKYFGKE